jgi:hypothetical protein
MRAPQETWSQATPRASRFPEGMSSQVPPVSSPSVFYDGLPGKVKAKVAGAGRGAGRARPEGPGGEWWNSGMMGRVQSLQSKVSSRGRSPERGAKPRVEGSKVQSRTSDETAPGVSPGAAAGAVYPRDMTRREGERLDSASPELSWRAVQRRVRRPALGVWRSA